MTIFQFLQELEAHHVPFRLERVRETVMVTLAVPGERWEVEFFDDGSVEVERFRSTGEVTGSGVLDELWPLTE